LNVIRRERHQHSTAQHSSTTQFFLPLVDLLSCTFLSTDLV
jgi:hypothetical protein